MNPKNRHTGLGTVTEVHIKDNKREIYTTVEMGPSNTHPGIPFYSGGKNLWSPPREGDEVEVYQMGKNSYAARKPKFPPEQRQKGWQSQNSSEIQRPADLVEDDVCMRFDDGSEVFIRRELDEGTEVRSLYVNMTGDIVFQAGGEIRDEPGTGKDEAPPYFPEDRTRGSFD